MKLISIIVLFMTAFQANCRGCDLSVMTKKVQLEHVHAYEQPNWMKPEKMDWVVFCLKEPLETSQQSPDKINSGLNFNDLYGVKIVIEPTSKKITEVRLSWHENTIAMISGILSAVEFNGEVGENHIKGEIQSIEKLTAQQSEVINEEMITENIDWEFAVKLNHDVIQADSKVGKQ